MVMLSYLQQRNPSNPSPEDEYNTKRTLKTHTHTLAVKHSQVPVNEKLKPKLQGYFKRQIYNNKS